MRDRMLRGWFGALAGTLLAWSAMSLVFSTLTAGVASPVFAAPKNKDEELETKTPAPKAGEKEKTAGEKTERGAGEKAVGSKGAGEKSVGDKAAGEEEAAKKLGGTRIFLIWLYKSLTLRYTVIFLIITFNAVALVVMIVLGLRRIAICPDDLLAAIDAKIDQRQYQEVYELARGDKSFLGKVLAAGMAKLSLGHDAAQEAMQETGEELNMKLEQRNGYIALIAQIAPMFGLLGTVDGMVTAFDVIATHDVTPKPSELAQGIGTALVTTVVGLWIAIPMIAFYHIIRNRLTQLMFEAGTITGDLLKRLVAGQAAVKKS
jgi:biopolymer transport protein ExbB